jgi:hypothetical protein
MAIATITLSSTGQDRYPQGDSGGVALGSRHRTHAGLQRSRGHAQGGMPKKSGRNLADLIGMLRHDGPPISTEELCEPVDYSADWQESEKRSQ